MAEVATWLGVSERLVYKQIAEGTIPARRLGRCMVVSLAWLEHWIAEPDQVDQVAS